MSRSRALTALVALAALAVTAALAPAQAPAATSPGPATSGGAGATVDLVVHRGADRAGLASTFAAHPEVTAQRSVPELGFDVVSVPADQAPRLADELAAAPGVEQVERDATARVLDTVTPDDPRWPQQWGPAKVGSPAAWGVTTGDEDVTVAVLDTGVDPDHPDLEPNLRSGRDFTATGGGGTDTDDHHEPVDDSNLAGHGTMSAGVLGAVADNGMGVAGMCWSCTIMPVRVMEPDGRGQLSRIAEGMQWAVDQGADVINLSLGSPEDRQSMRDAVAYARERDVAVVAATGNTFESQPVYPAAYDGVIGVAASDEDDDREQFSSYGPWADLAAPGCNHSTQPDGGYTPLAGDGFCGTSSAAPLVSGTLALALAIDPEATVAELTDAVRRTAEPVGDWVAHGRLDASATLEAVTETATPAPARVAGRDRFATAAQLSEATFEPGTSVAYLATGTDFADALAAGAAAGARGGPVLLATPDTLPEPTRAELARLRPETVVVAGGTNAVSSGVAAAAGEAAGGAAIDRLAGDHRFATASALAVDTFPDGAPVVYVATGEAFADALSAVPAAVVQGGPVLLTGRDQLPQATARAVGWLSPHRVVVLGGQAAVSSSVAQELTSLAGAGGLRRLAGSTRFATAARVSQAVFDTGPAAAHLATGTGFADALAGGPAAGATGGPLLLATRDTLPQPTAEELARLQPQTTVTLGAVGVISTQVQTLISQAAGS